MRKSRTLSLLLAVAVMATMLVAVPLTASAEITDKYAYEWVADFPAPTSATPNPNPEITTGTKLSFTAVSGGDSGDSLITATTGGAANHISFDSNFRFYLTSDSSSEAQNNDFSSSLGFRISDTIKDGNHYNSYEDLKAENSDHNFYTGVVLKPQVDGKFKAYVGVDAGGGDRVIRIYDNTESVKKEVVTFSITKNKYNNKSDASPAVGELGNEQIYKADGKRVYKVGGKDKYNDKYVKYTGAAVDPSTNEITLTAGHDYIFYVAGTGGRLLRMEFEPTAGESEATPEPGATSDPGATATPGGGGTDTETVTAAGYSNSFKSTNKNYVDWTFHKESRPDPDYANDNVNNEDYRTSNGLAADFSETSIEFSGTIGKAEIKTSTTVANDTFDLPHTEHTAHSGSGYVLKVGDTVNLTIKNAKPDDSVYSYDLIIVYNRNGGSGQEAKFTISQDGSEDPLKDYTDTTKDNGNTTDPDEVIFRNVNVKDVKLTWNKEIDIYSISLDYHAKPRADVENKLKLENGSGDNYVSGKYYQNDDTGDASRGVIRFFQDCSNNDLIDGYGFVFIDGADAGVIDTNIKKGRIVQSNDGENVLSGNGFYGDVYNILDRSYSSQVIAVPYVSADGYIIFADPITGTVGDAAKDVINEWEWVD